MKSTRVLFRSQLLRWYRRSARALPWRETQDPYPIWISEVMLQQTTVTAVIPFYNRWMKRFPDIRSVAKAQEQTVLKYWQGLGYYSRARNIHATAKIITSNYGTVFPTRKDQLEKLPGFGPYTVGAVLSIAFDQRQPIIDANVRRVVMRQLKINGFANNGHDPKILRFLNSVMPQRGNRIFNQALMELGALVCRSKNPLCARCPVQSSCQAFQDGRVEVIPLPRKTTMTNVHAVIGVLTHNGKYFLQRRASKGLFAGLWEFPGGKIESKEAPREAVLREINEELAIDAKIIKELGHFVHYYTQFKAHLSVWLCQPLGQPPIDKDHKWLTLKDIKNYPLPSGSAKIVTVLASQDQQ